MNNSDLSFFADHYPAFTEKLLHPARMVFTGVRFRATFDQKINKSKIMKTLITLTTAILMTLSLNTFAGTRSSDDKPKSMVAVSPFVWGNPNENAPAEIRLIKAKYAIVPKAPFVWGDPSDFSAEDIIHVQVNNLNVPVAPFVWGNADDPAPVSLKYIIAVNADVPVAPFVWGNADQQAPELSEVQK